MSKLIETLEQWLADAEQLDGLCSKLLGMGFDIESDIVQQACQCFESLMRQYSERVGAGWNTLSWYWYDNDKGARGLQAGVDGDVREIKDLNGLAWLLSGLD